MRIGNRQQKMLKKNEEYKMRKHKEKKRKQKKRKKSERYCFDCDAVVWIK